MLPRLLLIAALGASALLAPTTASAATLDVCPSGCPYQTPQEAVDAADVGDVVAIAAGTYGGIVLPPGFEADGVTIHGASAATTTLTGGLVAANDQGGLITGLTVRDLTLDGAADVAPAAVVSAADAVGGLEDLTLRRVVLDGGGEVVRLLDGGGNLSGTLTVADAELRDSLAPCVLATRCEPASTGLPMDEVRLSGLDVHDVAGAVRLRSVFGSSRIPVVAVVDSDFRDVGPLDGGGALSVRNASTLVVEGNAFSGIEGAAMSLRGIGEATIQRNRVTGADAGIVVPDGDGEAQVSEAWTGSISRNDLDVSGAALSLPEDFAAGIAITGNSLRGALSYAGAGPLDARRNWWGCNAGPDLPGCSEATGPVDATPWLALGLSASPATPAGGQPVTLTAAMRDSDGLDATIRPVADRMVEFAADGGGSVAPVTAPIGADPASVVLSGPVAGGAVTAKAMLDAAGPTVGVHFPPFNPFQPPAPDPVPPPDPDPFPFPTPQQQLAQFEQQGEALERQAEEAQELADRGGVAPTEPVAGTCVDGVQSVGDSPVLAGPMEDCGTPPADPLPAIEETAGMVDELGEEIEELTQAGGFASQFFSAFSSWWFAAPASTVPSAAPPVYDFGPFSIIPTMLRPMLGWFADQITHTAAVFGIRVTIGPYGTITVTRPGGLRSAGATPRAKGMSKQEAWARIAAMRASLRVLTGKPAPPITAVRRLPVRKRVPVLILGCQAATCDVTLRPVLRFPGKRTQLPKQALQVAQGERTVAWVRLSRGQVQAVRRAKRAKLSVAIATGGEKQTVRARLKAA